jgi:hypothetical protein
LIEKVAAITDDISHMEICPIFSHFKFNRDDDDDYENDDLADFNVEPFSDDDVPEGPDLDDAAIEQQEANLQMEILQLNDNDDEDGPAPVVRESIVGPDELFVSQLLLYNLPCQVPKPTRA